MWESATVAAVVVSDDKCYGGTWFPTIGVAAATKYGHTLYMYMHDKVQFRFGRRRHSDRWWVVDTSCCTESMLAGKGANFTTYRIP